MRKLVFLPLLAFAFACADATPFEPPVEGEMASVTAGPLAMQGKVASKKPAASLRCTTDYEFRAHLGIFDAAGRLLVWEGNIHGDIEGQLRWWAVLGAGPPNMPETAKVSFYETRWEIWDDDVLLLEGNSKGKTASPPGQESRWRGNGIVTEAGEAFAGWIGRHTSEGGNVIWDPFPYSGEGFFRIN